MKNASSHPLCLRFDNVEKTFGKQKVLSHLSLEVPSGQSLVIIGRSGTGKSVLLKCALGLLGIEKGRIFIEGRCIQNISSSERESLFKELGVVFQSSALFDSLTVLENIAFRLGTVTQKVRHRVEELLNAVGLSPETANFYPNALSGGMKHRVALARALALQPKILFCDEPTGGLDPISARIIAQLIRQCATSIHATAVTITHDISVACVIADSIALLDRGHIQWQGSPQQMQKTSDPFITQFLSGNPVGPLS